jgi:hypothetical protein
LLLLLPGDEEEREYHIKDVEFALAFKTHAYLQERVGLATGGLSDVRTDTVTIKVQLGRGEVGGGGRREGGRKEVGGGGRRGGRREGQKREAEDGGGG